ncbi:MAG: 50S ribosomal protein L10 [Bacillota bacterium]
MGNRRLKEKKVELLKEDLDRAKIVVLTDYRGLTVAQMNKLRRILQVEGIKYKVVKNTLNRIAAKELGLEEINAYMQGPVAIAYGYDDPVTPVKLLVKFAKENEQLSLKGGLLEKQILDEQALRRLSDLPPRAVLLARTLGCFQAPLVGMLNVLQGNLRGLLYVLQAVKEKRESESA